MNNKSPKIKEPTKINDVTPAKMADAAMTGQPKIIIEKRAHLERPEATTPGTGVPATMPTTTKQTITPPANTAAAPVSTDKPEASASTPELSEAATDTIASDPTAKESVPDTEQPAKAAAAQSETVGSEAPEDEAIAGDAKEDVITTDDQPSQKSALVKNAEEARKAEEAAKRQNQLQEYIDTREFFVPINASARKRSIQVSLWLTLLYIILSVILVDFMLDSGMIDLIQKIPHTHFFSV